MLLLSTLLLTGLSGLPGDAADPRAGLATIVERDVEAHLRFLASPRLEGRDSPSRGLMLAAQHVAEAFARAGLQATADSSRVWEASEGTLPGLEGKSSPPAWSLPPAGEGTYLRPFTVERMPTVRGPLERPLPEGCSLEVIDRGGEDGRKSPRFRLGEDFVPLPGHPGRARGELVWVGFGIQSRRQHYDSLAKLKLRGKVAILLSGDPRGVKAFGGVEETAEASIWNKLSVLERAGVSGVIVVRRAPPRPPWMRHDPEPPPLGYRYTWASWNPPSTDRDRGTRIPAIEVSEACASLLLGRDLAGLERALDKSSLPKRTKISGRQVAFASALEEGALLLPNLVGILPGRDPALAGEYVIVGAHMDHIGVGVRGRIGTGADDNASGTSALLEVLDACVATPPRRSLIFAVFSGEEDGLLGSRELAQHLPVPKEAVVAMVNLDMIGRGESDQVYCLGFAQNPGMEAVVERARDLGRTGIKHLERCNDKGLFRRSDHYSFHQVGLPTVFFFENFPLEQNHDYHTWRDTFEGVDLAKVTHTARLAFCTAWLLAEDEKRLPAPVD